MTRLAVERNLLVMNCFTHTAQLLLSGILSHWSGVVGKAESLQTFFRRGYPRQVYLEEMSKVDGTLLIAPGQTRWGSRVDTLQSVVKNNTVIDHALGRLRREKFKSADFDSLGWVWVNQHWDDMEQILMRLITLRQYIATVESDDCTLGKAVHGYLELRGELEQWIEDLPNSLTNDLRKVFLSRDAMFLKPHACASYFLDARYWADLLSLPKVRETVQYLMETAWPLFGEGDPPIRDGYPHWAGRFWR